MLAYFCLLFAGCFCLSFTDPQKMTALQNTEVTLPCPHADGDVSWSRYRNGEKVTLVTVTNGHEHRTDQRYSSTENKALVIANVQSSDSTWYLCNNKPTVYLNVTTDPSMVHPVTPGTNRLGPGLGTVAAGDAATENQQPTDGWKIPAGAVIGAALVLLAFVSLRFCSEKRAKRNTSRDETESEVIYEVIKDDNMQPNRESDVESPYYWSSIVETPNTCKSPNPHLYSSVNKLKTEGRCADRCVYSLAQTPPQTGSAS